MKFSFFFIAEYANVVTVCAMVTTLFFGGWDIPFTRWDESGGVLQSVATAGFFFLKVMFWIFFVMWIRWTLPRFRYDQLMGLGWKVLLPLALAYIMVICVAIYVLEHRGGLTDPIYKSLALFGLNVVIAVLVFGLLDSGVFVKGSARQRHALNARARGAEVTG
jgi:NADH-quinone oxidoreductase subunit H